MKSLVQQLTERTQELKARFIEATKKASKRIFYHKLECLKRTQEEWYKAYGIKTIIQKTQNGIILNNGREPYGTTPVVEIVSPDPKEYHKKAIYKMRDAMRTMKIVVDEGYEKFEKKEVISAENHYKYSIEKLTFRLNKKGIVDGSSFKITNEWIGVNLHITIEHAGGITKAWTIIAEGPIQQAHYRYLVK